MHEGEDRKRTRVMAMDNGTRRKDETGWANGKAPGKWS